MNKILTKKQALIYPVWIIAVIIILTIFPLRLYHEEILMTDAEKYFAEFPYAVDEENPMQQRFIAQYDHLDSIEIEIRNNAPLDEIWIRVTDEEGKEIRKQWYPMGTEDENQPYRWVTFPLNLDLEVGKLYTIHLEGLNGWFWIQYETKAASGVNYFGDLTYGELNLQDFNLSIRFHYGQPLRKTASLLIIAVIGAFVAIYTAIICYLAGGKQKVTALESAHTSETLESTTKTSIKSVKNSQNTLQDLVTVQWAVKKFGNPILIIATLFAMIAIGPMHVFGKMIINTIFMEIGIIFLALIIWYAMNHERTGDDSFVSAQYVLDHIGDFLQAIFVAYGIWACINYMNGLYEVHHDIAYRQMLVFLGLSVIATYKRKEVINWYNPILIVVTGILARMYYVQNLPLMESEFHARALKWTCYLAVVIVVIAVNTVCILLQRKIKTVSPVYFICTAIMAAGVIIMRNTRAWPIMMVVAFSLYAIRYAAWDKKANLLPNLCNGILLNFIGCTIYCWLHRPYLSFVYYRYPHMYFTVTETATYLSMIYAAALIKILWKWYTKGTLKACYKEAAVYGMVVSYLLFTMSRTGFLAVGSMTIVMILLMVFVEKGKKAYLKNLGKTVGVLCLAVVWMFPITFTIQRCIPAIVIEPEAHEIEQFPSSVLIGDKMDSDDYMSFGRFVDTFLTKVLHAPSDFLRLDRFSFAKNELQTVMGPSLASNQMNMDWYVKPSIPVWMSEDEDDIDFTNGRTDIFRSYWEQMTWEGHDEMGALLQDGSLSAHAHNIYLQVAFDHGMIVGMIFILWVIATFIRGLLYYLRHRETNEAAILPFACIISFAMAGIAEWISHPCNPSGFILLLVIAPLIFDGDFKKKHGRKKETNV